MKPNNYRIPVAIVERKVTADELFLQALIAKHERVADYVRIKGSWDWIPIKDCEKEFNEAIEHYKKLAWKEER